MAKTKVSKLWLPMVVVFMVILSISYVEAKSLKKGEEFKDINKYTGMAKVIRVVSSDEVEIEDEGVILIGKYTVDGERVRIVIMGTTVKYYQITPEGLAEEKTGKTYYSKGGLAGIEKRAEEEKRKAAPSDKLVKVAPINNDFVVPVSPPTMPKHIDKYLADKGFHISSEIDKGCRFDINNKNIHPFFIQGDFNGDGKKDYAIRVQNNEKTGKIFVFLSNGKVYDLAPGGYVYIWDYIFPVKKGIAIPSVSELQSDAIGAVACERGETVYIYNSSKNIFEHISMPVGD